MKDPFDKYERQLKAWAQRCYDDGIDPYDVASALKNELATAENKLEAAYDRHQEHLMETGGGPTLQEQQIEAMKLK